MGNEYINYLEEAMTADELTEGQRKALIALVEASPCSSGRSARNLGVSGISLTSLGCRGMVRNIAYCERTSRYVYTDKGKRIYDIMARRFPKLVRA